ncbi:MAG: TetR/AcrR family transcriptional regulator C-terminal domain-containing protein [Anaerolineaceae bacterium]|nr:TetR/AcrR family transcriptional regulator C-terminal domain-containing protein [Anaerolineaceae bacterium]
MKRKTAKELLADSFRELAGSRNIDKITIQDIVGNCGYSPATFYRNFKDKYDLIAWDYARGTALIMDRIDDKNYFWPQTLIDGAYRFLEEKEYLQNLLLHTTGHDSFVRYMTEINCTALRNHLLHITGKEKLDHNTELYIRVYCHGTVNLTCEWILGKQAAEPEVIAEIYRNSLPQPLLQVLSES